MNKIKDIINSLLYADNFQSGVNATSLKSAVIEVTIDRREFFTMLNDFANDFEIREVFSNANDWELTFYYKQIPCNVALHSWLMVDNDDVINLRIVAGLETSSYYNKDVFSKVMENTQMFKYFAKQYNLV